MIYSGPKFDGPNIDYLSWLLARRGYRDDSEVFVDAADPANRISYAELVDLTKRLGQGLRELEGIGAHGAGKDVVIVYSENQVSFILAKLMTDYVSSVSLGDHLRRRCILRYRGQHRSR
jgi:acyl-CoA synthetase (AMP-forming)/AMP-acid ligase II